MKKVVVLRRIAAAAIPVLLTLSACAPSAGVSSGDVVRTDSSGVRIITSGAEDVTLDWTFEDVDVLRDSLGEPWLFTGVYPGAVVTDRIGRTYVMTRDPSIVRFGRDGQYEHTMGRRGGGPGEMEFPVAIGVKSDTLYALDAFRSTLVRWGPTFEPVSNMPLEGALQGSQAIAFRFGGLWYSKRMQNDSAVTIALYGDSTSAPLYSVSTPNVGPVNLKCVSINGSTPLFSPDVTWSASGPRIAVNASTAYEIWLHEGTRPIASIRRALAERAPTIDDVRQLWPEGYKVSFGGDRPMCVAPVELIMEQFGTAPVMPAMKELTLLSDGTIWVQRSWADSAPVLDVFGSDGAYAGTIQGMRMPVGLLPNGELLVPREDEMSGGYVIVRTKVTR